MQAYYIKLCHSWGQLAGSTAADITGDGGAVHLPVVLALPAGDVHQQVDNGGLLGGTHWLLMVLHAAVMDVTGCVCCDMSAADQVAFCFESAHGLPVTAVVRGCGAATWCCLYFWQEDGGGLLFRECDERHWCAGPQLCC